MLRTLKEAQPLPIPLSCIPFKTDDVDVDVKCKKSPFLCI